MTLLPAALLAGCLPGNCPAVDPVVVDTDISGDDLSTIGDTGNVTRDECDAVCVTVVDRLETGQAQADTVTDCALVLQSEQGDTAGKSGHLKCTATMFAGCK